MRILRSIEFLETAGPFLKPPYAKKISRNLYELRIKGRDEIRIFYTRANEDYVLLHAFKKKTQKTPRKEIGIAIDRMRELI